MLRRISVLLVVLACALAPVASAIDSVVAGTVSCACCEGGCGQAGCPMSAPVRADHSVTATAGNLAVPAETQRSIRTVTTAILFHAKIGKESVGQCLGRAERAGLAASAPLYKAHCSFLL